MHLGVALSPSSCFAITSLELGFCPQVLLTRSGRDDEIWSACKKKIRFVELPVNSSRRRGKQRELELQPK